MIRLKEILHFYYPKSIDGGRGAPPLLLAEVTRLLLAVDEGLSFTRHVEKDSGHTQAVLMTGT